MGDAVVPIHFMLVSQTFSSYIVYKVMSTLHPEGVERRYSDFDWLRDILVSRFHGMAIPLLPEKRVVGNQGEEFINERMRGLELWLRSVVGNPYLRNDATLRLFLTTRAPAEFEQVKKAASQGSGSNPGHNEGLSQWFGCLRHYPLPMDAETSISEVEGFVKEAEEGASNLLKVTAKYWERANLLSQSLKHMRDHLIEYSHRADARSASLGDSLALPREDTAAAAALMGKSAEAWGQAYDLSVFAPNEIQIFLTDAISQELQRVRALKYLLDVRQAAKTAYGRAWQAQDKLQFEAKSHKDRGNEQKAAQLAPRIADAQNVTRQNKERLDDMTKGIIHFEARKNTKMRIEKLTASFGQFAALNIATGAKIQELWGSFIVSADLDQDELVQGAEATLRGQDEAEEYKQQLPPPPEGVLTGRAPGVHAGAGGDEETAHPDYDRYGNDDDADDVDDQEGGGGATQGQPAKEQEAEEQDDDGDDGGDGDSGGF